jgi:RNA recognition motif-containing protein
MTKSQNLVLVGDIPKTSTEQEIKTLFSQFGQIKNLYFRFFPDFLSTNNLNDLVEMSKITSETISKSKQQSEEVIGLYCLVSFSRKESVEKCIYANVNIGTKQLLIMKVKEDEMHWVLKNGKKPGLKDLAEQDIIHSDEDTESQL